MSLAPIIIFVYNRIEHTKKTIEALEKNVLARESNLIIYSDAPKDNEDVEKVKRVREYIRSINGFKSINIIDRSINLGLANSIIKGVTEVVNKYNKVIVLEDDLVTSPYFLSFMNKCLELYKEDIDVCCIHGYTHPLQKQNSTYFIKGNDCWGWGTWKRAWDKFESDGEKLLKELNDRKAQREFDFDNNYPFTQMLKDQIEGKNNSWAIRWKASAFLHNMLTLYPPKSLVQNIGNDNTGVHSQISTIFNVDIELNDLTVKKQPIKENYEARKDLMKFYKSMHPSVLEKIKLRLKRIVKQKD